MTAGGDLLERDAELAEGAERLAAAGRGAGGVLVLEGAPGAGKTALLRALRAAAADGGFEVLPAVGGELERDFPLGLVRQLFEARIAAADAAERERLFTGAASVAAPVIGGEAATTGELDASFALLHALYWVTVGLTESGPLLLAVDDAHWGDPESLRFLEFLGRRAGELRLLVALATRPSEPGADVELLQALADGPAATVLRPAPLTAAGVAAVLGDVGEDVVATAVEATGGNPLLTTELARELTDGDGPATAAAVRAAVPSSVTRSVARRLGRLPADTREVATALAVLGDGRRVALLSAVTGVTGARMAEALDALVAVGLLADPTRGDEDARDRAAGPRFAHPLLRAAAADGVPPSLRDRLHHAAARALRDADPGGELALHLLASAPLGEPWAVDALREAADRARAEGANDAALRLLHRAEAEHPEDPAVQERLGLEIGVAALWAGSDEARPRLVAAMGAGDRAVVLEAAELLMSTGLVGDVPDADVHAAMREALDALDPEAESAAYDRIGAVLINSLSFPHRAHRRRETLDALHRTAPGLLAHRAFEYAAGPEPAAEIVAAADGVEAADSLEPHALERSQGLWAVIALISVEAERSNTWLARAERALSRRPTRYGLAFHGFVRTLWQAAHGSVASAEAGARECLELFERAGNALSAFYMQAELASALVLRDDLDGAEAALDGIGDDAFFQRFWGGGHAWPARAELELARGRPEAALAALALLDEILEGYGWARYPRGAHRALQAEALLVAGRTDEALALARGEAREQRRRDAPRLVAEALRVQGLAEGGDAGLATLAAAVQQAERPGGGAVTLARARLDHGAALRRAGRRREARDVLADARATAARFDAAALERRAVEELVVAGGRPRRRAASGSDALTPSERRMAEHAAAGLTNRQIAETLFVTRKTVETTLGHAYGKLGIRSRAQLTEALGR